MPAPSILDNRGNRIVEPRNLLSSLGEVVYTWDMESDELRFGPNAVEVLGAITQAALTRGLAFAGLVEPGSGRSRYDAIVSTGARDLGEGAVYRTRYAANLAGRRMWIEDAGRWFGGLDGRPARAHGVLRLERLVRPEELDVERGDFGERATLIDRVETTLSEDLPAEKPVALLVAAIDGLQVDGLKIDGCIDPEMTEEVVREVQRRLYSVMRRRDQLLRYCGDQFAVLLSGCPADQVEAAARRFSTAVARSAIETSRGIVLGRLRIGAAIAPDLTRHAGTLVEAAEHALEDARACAAEDAVLARRAPRQSSGQPRPAVSLEAEALAALNDRRIRLALQPVVRAAGRQVAFSEALLRVERPNGGGFIATAELIPLLEQRGLVRLFDHRVLELAMGLLAEDPHAVLSVNVSPRSLDDPEWLAAFLSCTAGRQDIATRLIVEITETATVENPERVARLLTQVKERGARIAIDDFGAGHTSLRHLRTFPIDILKLDGAFTQNLRRSTDDRFFVRTLLDLARHLEVETVAEWVDDEMQAAMLCEWGVTYLQGHLIGKAELPQPEPVAAEPALPARRSARA